MTKQVFFIDPEAEYQNAIKVCGGSIGRGMNFLTKKAVLTDILNMSPSQTIKIIDKESEFKNLAKALPDIVVLNEKNHMNADPRLKIIEALLCGHTFVWRLNHADRRFSNYIYTIRFIASLYNKSCYRRYVKKFLKCLLHDTQVSTSRKHEVLFYLYYYSTWVWPISDNELYAYYSEFK